jgi:hypothetical protein
MGKGGIPHGPRGREAGRGRLLAHVPGKLYILHSGVYEYVIVVQ